MKHKLKMMVEEMEVLALKLLHNLEALDELIAQVEKAIEALEDETDGEEPPEPENLEAIFRGPSFMKKIILRSYQEQEDEGNRSTDSDRV